MDECRFCHGKGYMIVPGWEDIVRDIPCMMCQSDLWENEILSHPSNTVKPCE